MSSCRQNKESDQSGSTFKRRLGGSHVFRSRPAIGVQISTGVDTPEEVLGKAKMWSWTTEDTSLHL